jgi:hypothetical protein
MVELQPCLGCRRHVAVTETACPFCGAAQSAAPAKDLPRGRLSRAAVFAVGALAVAGCGGKTKPDNNINPPATADASPAEAPADAAAAEVVPDHIQPMPYGAPPARRRVV